MLELPDSTDVDLELFDVIAPMCGLQRSTERHIKIYQKDSEPDPPAHKDRLPSQVAVGTLDRGSSGLAPRALPVRSPGGQPVRGHRPV